MARGGVNTADSRSSLIALRRLEAARFLILRVPLTFLVGFSTLLIDYAITRALGPFLFLPVTLFMTPVASACMFAVHAPAALRLLAPHRRHHDQWLHAFGWSFIVWCPMLYFIFFFDVVGVIPALLCTFVLGACSGRLAWALAPVPLAFLGWLITPSLPSSSSHVGSEFNHIIAAATSWNVLMAAWAGLVGMVLPSRAPDRGEPEMQGSDQ